MCNRNDASGPCDEDHGEPVSAKPTALETLAKCCINGDPITTRSDQDGLGIIEISSYEGEWSGPVAEWQAALLGALSAKFVEGALVITVPIQSSVDEIDKTVEQLSESIECSVVVMRENWKAYTAKERADLLKTIAEFDEPYYDQLTDWVRAQPSGTSNLAVFPDEGDGEFASIQRGDNDGKFLGLVHESELIETLASGREYSAVWLSRHVDPSCEAKIPRGVKVYRER